MSFNSAYPDLMIERGADTLSTSQVTIGAASATLLAANPARSSVQIKNTHATQTLHVSGATPATVLNGFSVAPASTEIVELKTGAILYAISNGATTVVELAEVSQG